MVFPSFNFEQIKYVKRRSKKRLHFTLLKLLTKPNPFLFVATKKFLVDVLFINYLDVSFY